MTLAGPVGRALTIVAIADDPVLLDAITHAGAERDAVITSPTADRFVDQLVANAAAVAVIDAGCAPQPLEGFIDRMHAQFPQLLLILAGSAPLQAAFATRLVDGTLFRFAHKPASAQRMQLFVDAARRHLEAARADAHPGFGAPSIEQDAAHPSSPLRSALMGVVLLAALLGLGWSHLHQEPAAPAAAPLSPEIAVPAPIAKASAHAAPVARVTDDPLASAAPGTLPIVAAAMPAGPFLELARARLSSHDLIEPAGDSALFYVEAAQAVAPEDPEVSAAALALGEALIAQARAALNTGDLEAARHWLRACTDYHVSQNTIADLSARLQALETEAPAPGSRAP
jgi:hypothetical protein